MPASEAEVRRAFRGIAPDDRHGAAFQASLDAIKFVARHGPDLSSYGICPLFYVARLPLAEQQLRTALGTLVTQGCDPNGIPPGHKMSMLRTFVCNAEPERVSALLYAGADVADPRHNKTGLWYDHPANLLERALELILATPPSRAGKAVSVALSLVEAGAQMDCPDSPIELLGQWCDANEQHWDRFDVISPLVAVLSEQRAVRDHASFPPVVTLCGKPFIGALHLLYRSGHTRFFGLVTEMLERTLKLDDIDGAGSFARGLLRESDPAVFDAIFSVPTLREHFGNALASLPEHALDDAVSCLRIDNMCTLSRLGILQRMCAAPPADVTGSYFQRITMYFSRDRVPWFEQPTDHRGGRGRAHEGKVTRPEACLHELGLLGLPLRTYLAKAVMCFPADVVARLFEEKRGAMDRVAVGRAFLALSYRLDAQDSPGHDEEETVRRIYCAMCQHNLDSFVDDAYIASAEFKPAEKWGPPARIRELHGSRSAEV